MKKLLSLVLALAMLLSCGAAMAENEEGSKTPATFSVMTMRWAGMGDSFATNPFLVNLEKEMNVKVDWQIVSSADWFDTQKPVLLAGGESVLPDVFLGFQTLGERHQRDRFCPDRSESSFLQKFSYSSPEFMQKIGKIVG